MKSKKGQEEIVGFVLIVLLITVILVIFLGIYLSGKNKDLSVESSEVSQFVEAMMQYSSDCSLNQGFSYENLGDLATNCATSNSLCENGKSACEVLKNSTKEAIESSWVFGSNSPNRAYRFTIKAGNTTLVSQGSGGACSSSRGSGGKPLQEVSFNLKICLN